ncbi:helix-turn-helix domain-containing protein [Parashewanella spongiae]|uniref:Helix-turn-helix domain-containing protein n=1 Tax=Parashewanella spongiae TaxID=342950 RepID=A0A3A6U9Z6_9GAMM|nr:helix-turn-helix domain-containing protein [Parashewanella spongiae]
MLSNKKFSIKQIADIFEVCEITVSNWITAWYEQGVSSLFDDKRSGRPSIYSQEEASLLKSFVDEEPHQLKRAQSLIQNSTGKECSLGTVKRTIKKI